MAKTRTDIWDWWATPSLLFIHMPAGHPPSHTPFAYHAIALWNCPHFCPWDGIVWTPVPEGWDPDWDHTDEQYQMTRALIGYPELLSDICPECHQSYYHAYKLRWNLSRNGSYPWRVPACAWNGSSPPEWSPDQWPPLLPS